MRPYGTKRFTSTTYRQDLKEFTGKSYEEWYALRQHYEALGGVDTITAQVLSDWTNPSFEDLFKAYNHESWMAYGYTGNFVREEMVIREPESDLQWAEAALLHFMPGMIAMDWGAGSGNSGNNLWNIGYNTYLADLPLDWFKFMELRAKKYNTEDLHFLHITQKLGWVPKGLKFDFIVWHQVAEHTIDPDLCVEEMVREHMNVGSLIWISCSFTATTYHLVNNRDKFGLEKDGLGVCSGNWRWREHLESIGLEEIEKHSQGSIFKKVK